MRHSYAGLVACAVLAACAQGQGQVSAPALQALAAAPKMAPISDAEPEVTRQVSAFLGRVGQGLFTTEQLTDNLRDALTTAQMQAMSRTLAPCRTAPALELLRRTTKGEDRQYVYRVPCGGNALLVEIDFNKGAKINKLLVRPE